MSKPWGTNTIGSWAAEAEREEAEEREMGAVFRPSSATPAAANPASFPSLKEAITAKPKKKKMSLSEFNTYPTGGSSFGSGSTRLTPDEMLQLPTAPKQRDPDDYSGGSRLGGGFSSYGDDRRGGPRRFDDDRRGAPPPRRDFESQISRADEVDNWAAGKRSIPPPDSGRSSSRYSSLGGGSKADDADNWNFGKKPVAAPPPGRSSTFGSSFRDSGSDWRRGGDVGGEREETGRPRLVLDPRTRGGANEPTDGVVVVKTEKSNPFGAARPREQVLAEKGLDWKKLDLEIEAKKGASSSSRPTSSQGSRPTSSQSNRSESVGLGGGEVAVKPRPKVNPFGDAKPREVLLQEKGLDWRKIDLDLEHRRVNRPETEQERALKEEIENLKKELEKESGGDVSQESGGEQANLRELVQSKETELETLIRELDDKVRFGQKAVERPGSGAGRFTGFPERPPSQSAGERPGSGAGRFTGFSDRPPSSQSASFEDARGPETMDRPRSRGTGADVWTRPGEDRRGSFQGARDRGFLGNRDFDRSRDRW